MTDQSLIRATMARDLFDKHLAALPHPSGLVRLVMFAHDSPGLRKLRKQVSEALVLLLESNGFHLCNGLTEARQLLESHGYRVSDPAAPASGDPLTPGAATGRAGVHPPGAHSGLAGSLPTAAPNGSQGSSGELALDILESHT